MSEDNKITNKHIYIIILSFIISLVFLYSYFYILNNVILLFISFLSHLFSFTYMFLKLQNTKLGKYILIILIMLFFLLISIYINIDKTTISNFMLTYFIFLILTIPSYIFPFSILSMFNLVLHKISYSKYVHYKGDELFREDNMLINMIGIFQALVLIGNLDSPYKNILIIGMILFAIPRAIAHIKDNNQLRLLSANILIGIITIDLMLIFVNVINEQIQIKDIFNAINLPPESFVLLFGFWFFMSFFTFFDEIIRERYETKK